MAKGHNAPLGLGFIGGSLRSAVGQTHYCASTMDNIWHVTAGCFSRNAEINSATGTAFGVPTDRIHADWRVMLAAERNRLDAICVLTPTPDHAAMVTACLEAGIPVICEKSLATTSAEARRIGAARDRRRGFLAITYNYSGYPIIRELRHLIRSGAFGKLLHFQAEMPQEGFVRTDARGNKPTPQAWRLRDGQIPTIHLDLGVHVHQLLYYLTGAHPAEAMSDQANHGWFSNIVDDVNCLCRYENGLHGHIWFSKSALGHRNGLRLRLYGTHAAAEWVQANPEEICVNYADGRRTIIDRAGDAEIASLPRYARFKPGHPAGFVEAFANLYADIATSLRHWRITGEFLSDEVFSAEFAIEGLRFLEAMCDSAAGGGWRHLEAGELHAAA